MNAKAAAEFDQWWDHYPRKVGKLAARRSFARARKIVGLRRLLAQTVEFARAVGKWPKAEQTYCPFPATWLNQGRWDDDPAEWWRRVPQHQRDTTFYNRKSEEQRRQRREEDDRVTREREEESRQRARKAAEGG